MTKDIRLTKDTVDKIAMVGIIILLPVSLYLIKIALTVEHMNGVIS